MSKYQKRMLIWLGGAFACHVGMLVALGCWLVLTERDNDGHILGVQAVKVDGESIKADTWYELRGGKVVEAKKEDNQ